MMSKTQISKRIKKKTNSYLVETIELANKKGLLDLAKKLSGPARKQTKINLDKLNKAREDKIIVAGKVLGSGEIEKKKKVFALGFSEQARAKLKKAGCEIKTIKQGIDEGMNGVKVI